MTSSISPIRARVQLPPMSDSGMHGGKQGGATSAAHNTAANNTSAHNASDGKTHDSLKNTNSKNASAKDNRRASVDINLKGFVGVGARGGILNWATTGFNVHELGTAGMKFLQGKPLAASDKLQMRTQVEFGGINELPFGLGKALNKIIPHADQSDAGAILKLNMSGNGKNNVPKLESVEGMIYADIPNNNGIVGKKTDQGFTNVAIPFSWKPGQATPSIGRPDFLNGQITSLHKPTGAQTIKNPAFDGWTVMGVTNNDQSNVLTPAIQNQAGRLSSGPNSRSNKVISGAVGAVQTANFFNDVKTSLDGRTVQKVTNTMDKKVNFSTTGLGIVQGIIKPTPAPWGVYVRGEASITATKDGKDSINFYSSGTKVGTVTVKQLKESYQNTQDMIKKIPGFGGAKLRSSADVPSDKPAGSDLTKSLGKIAMQDSLNKDILQKYGMAKHTSNAPKQA